MRHGSFTILAIAFAMVLVAVPPAAGDGVTGPDPMVNGDFSAAVPGTPVVPGWSMHSSTDPTEHWAEAVQVDGDTKVKTLGDSGYLGGPTNLGFSMERPVYSLLFDTFSFEVTDTNGDDLDNSGLHVMILAEWTDKWLAQTQADPLASDPDPETSVAIYWDDVSSAEAADGLTLANADGVKQFNGGSVDYEMSDFSDEELANDWTLGAVKIGLPGQVLLLDDFQVTEPTLFGTYS